MQEIRQSWWGRRAVASLGALVLLTAACGGDDDDSSTTGSPASNETDEAQVPDGEPIPIMLVSGLSAPTSAFPQPGIAAEAAVNAINEAGGINGRPLELTLCNDNNTPNETATCGRDAVESDAVAVIGGVTFGGDSLTPILEDAGIAYIGANPISPTELSSSISFPLVGGSFTLFSGLAALMGEVSDDVGLVTGDIPAGRNAAEFFEDVAEDQGTFAADTVFVPVDAPDLSAQAARIVDSDIDGLGATMQTPPFVRMFTALQGTGGTDDLAIGTAASTLQQTAFDSLGDSLDGVYAVSHFPPITDPNPEMQRFVEEMRAQEPDISDADLNDNAKTTWAGVQVLATVLRDMDPDDISAATVLEAMGQASDIDVGIVPPLDFTQEFDDPDFPRAFNRAVVYMVVEDGAFVPLEGDEFEFVDPFAG